VQTDSIPTTSDNQRQPEATCHRWTGEQLYEVKHYSTTH
jgi:hypothetical protein